MNRYKSIKINGIKHDEHRYLMEQHLGRKLTQNEVVHHKDGNPLNNDLSNLEIMPLSEHARMHQLGKHLSGVTRRKLRMVGRSQLFFAKLTVERVIEIKGLLRQGESKKSIAQKYHVHPSTIFRIAKGANWAWVA